jgi:hypothetical protein
MTLYDALMKLSERYALSFDINEVACRQAGLGNVLGLKIAKEPLPPMRNVALRTVFRAILDRIPVSDGATYYLSDQIEITTRRDAAAHAMGGLAHEAEKLLFDLRTADSTDVPRLPVQVFTRLGNLAYWHNVLVRVGREHQARGKVTRSPVPHAAAEWLTTTVDSAGFDDPELTLEDAVNYFSNRYDLNIDIDESAFRRDGLKGDVWATKIAKPPIRPLRGVRLDYVLRKVLARIPSQTPATYLIRDRHQILITTTAAARKEILGDSDRPLLPLVHGKYEASPLDSTLQWMSEVTGISIILDSGIGRAAKNPVSGEFNNVPVDSAVRVLADMADLSMVAVDNTLYVTSRDKAKTLREELKGQQISPARKRMPLADDHPRKNRKENGTRPE